jgi:hypothetical protein
LRGLSEADLVAPLEEADHLALLKANAAYTLVQLRGPRTAAWREMQAQWTTFIT